MVRLSLSILLVVATAINLTHGADHLALLGTYTGEVSKGIYAVRLDAETGALSTPELVAELPSPEFLALHPNGKIIYALTRVETPDGTNSGAVAAFEVDVESGHLVPLNVQPANGSSLTHLAVDSTGRMLIAASYGGGYVVSFPIEPDGRPGPRASFFSHEGPTGPNAGRQDKPHPHSVTISPDNRFAFVADLGLDRIFTYELSPKDGTISPHDPAFFPVQPGAGPRHTAFSTDGTTFYVLDELDCTVTSCRYDGGRGTAEPFQRISTLPDGFKGANTASEIRVHPNGRFVYSANRGHDSLAVFARDSQKGNLTRIEVVPCGGNHPRNFNLTPDGAWLLCAHQHSNSLAAFRVNAHTGRLTAVGKTVSIPTPVCVLFLR